MRSFKHLPDITQLPENQPRIPGPVDNKASFDLDRWNNTVKGVVRDEVVGKIQGTSSDLQSAFENPNTPPGSGRTPSAKSLQPPSQKTATPLQESSHAASETVGGLKAQAWVKKSAARVREQSRILAFLSTFISGNQGTAALKLHRATPHYLSAQQQAKERAKPIKLPYLIFHPYNPRRVAWDSVIFFLLIWSVISVPYFLAFMPDDECQSNFLLQRSWFYWDLTMDIMFMIDILVTFRTAYMTQTGPTKVPELVVDPKRIAWNYCRGLLIVDIMSSLPYDVILLDACNLLQGANRILRGPKFLKLIKIIRMARVMRAAKIRNFLEKLRDLLNLNLGFVRLVLFLLAVSVGAHYNACIYFWLGEIWLDPTTENPSDTISWTTQTYGKGAQGPDGPMAVHDMNPSEQYLVSLYLAVTTMTTVGYGDITPKTTAEVVYSIFLILQGGAVFGFVIANLSTLISRINLRYMNFKRKMDTWEYFMHREELPPEMCVRIRDHLKYKYLNPVRSIPKMALGGLSTSLLRDMTMHMYRTSILYMPLFRGVPEYALTALALKLEPIQLAPGEMLYYEGQTADSVYFLNQGTIEMSILMLRDEVKEHWEARVMSDPPMAECFKPLPLSEVTASTLSFSSKRNKKHLVKTVYDGTIHWVGQNCWDYKFFRWNVDPKGRAMIGEGCVLRSEAKRVATAVASCWCTLFKLRKSALDELLDAHPQLRKIVHRLSLSSKRLALRRIVKKVIQNSRSTKTPPVAVLTVDMRAAINLPIGVRKRCDSYCVIEIVHLQRVRTSVRLHAKKQTLNQFNTRNPWFGEVFTFDIYDANPVGYVIRVSVYDKNAASRDHCFGQVDIALPKMRRSPVRQGEYIAHSRDVVTETEPSGQWYPLLQMQGGVLKQVRTGGIVKKVAQICISTTLEPFTGKKLRLDNAGTLVMQQSLKRTVSYKTSMKLLKRVDSSVVPDDTKLLRRRSSGQSLVPSDRRFFLPAVFHSPFKSVHVPSPQKEVEHDMHQQKDENLVPEMVSKEAVERILNNAQAHQAAAESDLAKMEKRVSDLSSLVMQLVQAHGGADTKVTDVPLHDQHRVDPEQVRAAEKDLPPAHSRGEPVELNSIGLSKGLNLNTISSSSSVHKTLRPLPPVKETNTALPVVSSHSDIEALLAEDMRQYLDSMKGADASVLLVERDKLQNLMRDLQQRLHSKPAY